MGTTLTGTTPQDTYDSLIKVTDNGPLSGTLKALSDGLGNDSTLSLSTTAASIAGTLAVSGNATFDTNTLFVDAANNRVGVGTASPIAILDVRATSYLTSTGTDGTLADAIILGNSSFPNTQSNRIRTSTSASAVGNKISIEAGNGTTGSYVDNQLLLTGDGVVSLGQGQLKFPATQVASADVNTLDDYEEGTWTMGVSFGGASVGVTYAANAGTYTKIGRKVTVNGYLQLSSKGSSTGTAELTGLPFTIGAGTGNYSSAAFSNVASVTFTAYPSIRADVSTTKGTFLDTSVLGVLTSMNDVNFSNSSTFIVSITYFV
jgi:hypothetical protein